MTSSELLDRLASDLNALKNAYEVAQEKCDGNAQLLLQRRAEELQQQLRDCFALMPERETCDTEDDGSELFGSRVVLGIAELLGNKAILRCLESCEVTFENTFNNRKQELTTDEQQLLLQKVLTGSSIRRAALRQQQETENNAPSSA